MPPQGADEVNPHPTSSVICSYLANASFSSRRSLFCVSSHIPRIVPSPVSPDAPAHRTCESYSRSFQKQNECRRSVTRLRCPIKSSGLRFSSILSTAAHTAPGLHLPPAAPRLVAPVNQLHDYPIMAGKICQHPHLLVDLFSRLCYNANVPT